MDPVSQSRQQDESVVKPPTHQAEVESESTVGSPSDNGRDAAMTPDIDREVAEAMAAMSPEDLADLGGDVGPPDMVEPGTELTGTVAGISGDDVFIQFGVKSQGVMSRSQFGKKEPLEIGRRVDVVVERFDADSSLLVVSRKGAIQRATWTNLTVGMIVEGRGTGVIKGGLEIDLKGIRAFMPGSHADVVPMKDISLLLNENVRCEVLEIDRRGKNVIVSRRKVIERENAEKRGKLWDELEVGQTRQGVVSRVVDFGAFVDIGGMDGLLHIGDLSWSTVEKVTDVVTPGQEISVVILKVEKDRKRVSLGYKQAQPDPWIDVESSFAVGTEVKARIMRVANFGAFAEVATGIEGLIPLSEMGWAHVRDAASAVSVGDLVDTVVIRLEVAKRRLALSMKQAQPDPWGEVLESFPEKSLVTGRVTRLTDFGVFVELVPGVEGLIHISELAEGRVRSCGDVVEVGQAVETRILSVDLEKRRISLSIRALSAPAAGAAASRVAEEPHQPKKRKKALRGGLSSHFDW